jgi:nucleoid DNA-binding protein
MNRQDLVEMLARLENIEPAAAADELDRLLAQIIRDLKKGNSVPLPGIGTLELRKKRISLRPAARKTQKQKR